MTIKQTQTQAELSQHREEHLAFLKASADAYDNGFNGEAKRLAVSIRVLVHDTSNSKSLLGQLGQKDVQFLDSAFPVVHGNKNTHCGLVMPSLSPTNGNKYIAFLDDNPHGKKICTSFDTWWESTVFIDDAGKKLSRKDLVLAIANQDGGAHVDPSLNQIYANLSRNNSLRLFVSNGKSRRPMEGPELAAIRQIAHEVLKSLIPSYAKSPVYPPDGIIISNPIILQGADARARNAELLAADAKARATNLSATKKVGRNDPCPCGSGKKFKKCCGAI